MTHESNREIQDWLDTLNLGVLFLDVEGKILSVNAYAGNWFASRKIDFQGQAFAQLFPEDQRKSLAKSLRRVLNGETVNAETQLPDEGKEGGVSVLLRLAPRRTQEGEEASILAVAIESPELAQARREIKNLIDRSKELERLVVTCPVTGIYNRRYFDMRFQEELARAERYKHALGIGILDLDGFKPINDRFGHPLGDAVLKQTADTLRKAVRNCDVVARLGGDEFAILVPEVSPKKLLPMAIRIRQKIQMNRVPSDLGHVGVTASIGLACYTPEEGEVDPGEPLRRADEALLRAKDEGGNRIILHGHGSE